MRYLVWSTVHKPSFTMSRVVSSDKPHTAVKRHGSSVAAKMQPSVLPSGGEPSPRVHPPTHSWALDNSKVFMFSDKTCPKEATVRRSPVSTSQVPKKNVFFCLEGFFCALTITRHRLLGPWWPVCFSAFPLPLTLDIGCLWWSHVRCWNSMARLYQLRSKGLPLTPRQNAKKPLQHLVGVNNCIIYPAFAFPSFILFIGEATEDRKSFFFPSKAFVFCYAELICQFHYLSIHVVGFYFLSCFFFFF